jgi:NAD+ synthase (glutamine-hydrolysing)
VVHSWGVVGDIIKSGVTAGILCDIGSPVIHHGNMYNCRILVIDGKIKGIRAKMNLADGDNYYETRWFGFWKEPKKISQFKLPKNIQEITGQKEVPIGDFLV